jgi:hypothetical protein
MAYIYTLWEKKRNNTMKRELLERLATFKSGDVIERMDLITEINPFLEKMISRKNSNSVFFEKIYRFMNDLPFTEPLDDFFRTSEPLFEEIDLP